MFKSVGQNLSSWWGGGTTTDQPETEKEQCADVSRDKKEDKSDTQTKAENTEKSEIENQPETDDQKQQQTLTQKGTDNIETEAASTPTEETEELEDAQTVVVNTAKEWGSYLFSVTKAATKSVTQTAKQLKTKVEDSHLLDRTLLGDFSKEQDKFVHENKEKAKRSEAAVPPWVGYNEEEAMKTQILALSSDKRNFMRNPPSGAQFQFDFETMQPVAKATLEEDPELVKMRFALVPKQVKEENFWRNYFYRVSLIKQSTQLTSLAEQTGSTGEKTNTKKQTTDSAVTEKESSEKETQPTTEQEEFPPESPNQDAEFVSDNFQDNGVSEEELRNEMQQLGMEEKKHDPLVDSPPVDDIPEWEKELQAELNEYEVITDDLDDADLDDADLESQILQEIEEESK